MLPDELTDDETARLRALRAVEGYAELGLHDFAWEELAPYMRQASRWIDVQETVLNLLMREKRWAEAIVVGQTLCRTCPDLPHPIIHTAFSLHETKHTLEALKTLRNGPQSLQQDALYHYNSACYLAVLGHDDEAREALRTAFALDESLQENARIDPDLATLRPRES